MLMAVVLHFVFVLYYNPTWGYDPGDVPKVMRGVVHTWMGGVAVSHTEEMEVEGAQSSLLVAVGLKSWDADRMVGQQMDP